MIRNNLCRYDDLKFNDNRVSASIEKIIHGGNIKTATSFSSGGRNKFLFFDCLLDEKYLTHKDTDYFFTISDVIHTK